VFNLKLDEDNGKAFFIKALVIVALFRLILSAWLPMTGDEAYFVVWGKNLDYGYYDHTPFVGWLIAAFLTVSDAAWWLRLPSVLLPVILAYAIFKILEHKKADVAALAALTFLVAPVNVINVLITTDTPLVLFSFVSSWYFYYAISEERENHNAYRYFVLSGLFLGLAFISKYFAVLLGVTYGFYILFFQRNKRSIIGLGLIVLMVLPFVLLNLWWNYNNCWSNILFNIYNRTSSENDSLVNFLSYIAILGYLLSPVIIFYIFKNRAQLKYIFNEKRSQIYFWLFMIPMLMFLVVLLRKAIGLHWLFSFYPFFFIAFSGVLTVKQWRNGYYFMLGLSSLHVLFIIALLILPIDTFTSKNKTLQNLVIGFYPEKLLAELDQYKNSYTFGMASYGMASVISYYSEKPFIIFSEGSVHAREDDKLTNYKNLDGKNILLLRRSLENIEKDERFFKSHERKHIEIEGVGFEIVLGKGFKYELYRKEVLSAINKKFYAIPEWLPAGQCGFKNKYSLN